MFKFDYLDDNVRFADQINGALFHGRQVVKANELDPVDSQVVYLGKEAGRRTNFKAVADKTRIWRGRLIHILAVENQSFVDYHMVLRNMLTECLSYQKQWKQKKTAHEREENLEIGTDEFMSGMTKEEKFMPVITLVVYCGTEHSWDGARCLYDLLEVNDELKEFITNYKLNLYDCHAHDTFDEYHTGLRQLFEMVRYGKDKEKLKEIMEENKEIYSSLDSDTKELLEVVAKVRMKEDAVMKNGEKKYDLCKAFVDMKLEGKEEGSQERLVKTVCIKLQKNKPADVIADELEEDISVINRIITVQREMNSYDVEQICEALGKRD